MVVFLDTVDINHDCSIILFDRYYLLSFRTVPVAEHVILLAHRLRTIWAALTNERVQNRTSFSDDTSKDDRPRRLENPEGELPNVIQKIVETENRIKQKYVHATGPMDKRQYQLEVESLCSKNSSKL